MYKTINFEDFRAEFIDTVYDKQFTYNGKKALYAHLTELEDAIGEDIKLDIIALCCEYTQYDKLKDIFDNYDNVKTFEELKDNTEVISFTDGIIIKNF